MVCYEVILFIDGGKGDRPKDKRKMIKKTEEKQYNSSLIIKERY